VRWGGRVVSPLNLAFSENKLEINRFKKKERGSARTAWNWQPRCLQQRRFVLPAAQLDP